jgi:hypothetical protein
VMPKIYDEQLSDAQLEGLVEYLLKVAGKG